MRQTGYVISVVVNAIVLWIVNNLLDWEWPSFLTDSFSDLLPIINISLIATIVVNVAWVLFDPEWFKHAAQAVLNVISLVAAVRTWQVFPFDFSAYSFDWEIVARVAIGLGIFGLVAATIFESVKAVQSVAGEVTSS